MVKKILATSVVVGSMFAFVGCGDDNNNISIAPVASVETGTAYYIDSAVSGVNYTCGSQEGITGAEGEFTFEVGESCTFYLGDIELRSVAVEELVDGESVYETDVEIARILQSLDSDGNPDNGITIDAEIVAALAEAGITELPNTAEELAVFEEVLIANELTIVTVEEAQAHLDETELILLLGGKTFYNIGDGWLDRLVFNADVTSATWTTIAGAETGMTSTDTFTIEGDRLIKSGDEEGYVSFAEATNDYLIFNIFNISGAIEGQMRLYFDQAKAEAYFETLPTPVVPVQIPIEFTQEVVSESVWYVVEYEIAVAYCNGVFAYDGSNDLVVSWNDPGDSGSVILPYSILDGKVVISHDGKTETETLLSYGNDGTITTSKTVVYEDNTPPPPLGNKKWFKTQTDAEAFLATYGEVGCF